MHRCGRAFIISGTSKDGTFLNRAKECSLIPARVIATCFALFGFAAAVVVGVAASNAASTVLWRAIMTMLIAWPIGRFIGGIAQSATEENIAAYKKQYPIPDDRLLTAPPVPQEEDGKELVAHAERVTDAGAAEGGAAGTRAA